MGEVFSIIGGLIGFIFGQPILAVFLVIVVVLAVGTRSGGRASSDRPARGSLAFARCDLALAAVGHEPGGARASVVFPDSATDANGEIELPMALARSHARKAFGSVPGPFSVARRPFGWAITSAADRGFVVLVYRPADSTPLTGEDRAAAPRFDPLGR